VKLGNTATTADAEFRELSGNAAGSGKHHIAVTDTTGQLTVAATAPSLAAARAVVASLTVPN
jgi:hypothetical protein